MLDRLTGLGDGGGRGSLSLLVSRGAGEDGTLPDWPSVPVLVLVGVIPDPDEAEPSSRSALPENRTAAVTLVRALRRFWASVPTSSVVDFRWGNYAEGQGAPGPKDKSERIIEVPSRIDCKQGPSLPTRKSESHFSRKHESQFESMNTDRRRECAISETEYIKSETSFRSDPSE